MNREQAQQFFEQNKIKYVLAQFVDIHGSAKAKAVPVEHLDMVLSDGAGFAGFALWDSAWGRRDRTTWPSATSRRCKRFPGCPDMLGSSATGS